MCSEMPISSVGGKITIHLFEWGNNKAIKSLHKIEVCNRCNIRRLDRFKWLLIGGKFFINLEVAEVGSKRLEDWEN